MIRSKEAIEEMLSSSIKPYFKNILIDMLFYLQNYMDIEDRIKLVNETKFDFVTEFPYILTLEGENGEKFTKILNDFAYGAIAYKSYIDTNTKEIKMAKYGCVVNKHTFLDLKQATFHELAHLLSSRAESRFLNVMEQKTGVLKRKETYENGKFLDEIIEANVMLNEAFTEYVSSKMYEEIYGEKYKFVFTKEDGTSQRIQYAYAETYVEFLAIAAGFTEKEELYEIYFNNNVEMLEEKLGSKGLNKDAIYKVVDKLGQNNKFVDSNEKVKKYFFKAIVTVASKAEKNIKDIEDIKKYNDLLGRDYIQNLSEK